MLRFNKWSLTPFHLLTLSLTLTLTLWLLNVCFNLPTWLLLVPIALIQFLSFLFFHTVKEKGNIAVVYYCGYALVIFLLFKWFNSMAITSLTYTQWLGSFIMVPQPVFAYFLSSTLMLSSMFIALIYYFVIIHFRPMVLILISALPATICIRMGRPTVSSYLFIFMGILLLLYMYYCSYEAEELPYTVLPCTKSYWSTMSLLLLCIFLTCSLLLIPGSNLSNPIHTLLRTQVTNHLQPNYTTSTLPKESTATSAPTALSDTPIFEVRATKPVYFRTRGWDYYEKNAWHVKREALSLGYQLPKSEMNQKLEQKSLVLLNVIERLEKSGLLQDIPELTHLLEAPISPITYYAAYVTTLNYSHYMYLNPPGLISISNPFSPLDLYLNALEICFANDKTRPYPNEGYVISYMDTFPASNSREMLLIESLDPSTYNQLINFLLDRVWEQHNLQQAQEDEYFLKKCSDEMETATLHFLDIPNSITKRTYDLAQKITASSTSTYEKALAIQNYFYNGEFTYDLNSPVTPLDKDAIEYFLFESKRGTCVQFASAMTMLCRAAGIPTRYMEGYVCEEYDASKGCYIIKQKHAHAFPEVYLPGYGWRIFEPTIPATENEKSPLSLILLLITCLMFLFILYFLSKVLSEQLWRLWIVRQEPKIALEAIYSRLLKRLKKNGYVIEVSMTPINISHILLEQGIDLTWLTEHYCKVHYGHCSCDKTVVLQALQLYKSLYHIHP